MKKKFAVVCIFLFVLGLSSSVFAARLSDAERIEEKGRVEGMASPDTMVTIDFRDADIRVVAKFISELTGKNFLFDKQVRGTVTVFSPTKVTPTEAYRLFESVLEVNGYTTVPSGEVIKIIPSVEARSKAVEIRRHLAPREFPRRQGYHAVDSYSLRRHK